MMPASPVSCTTERRDRERNRAGVTTYRLLEPSSPASPVRESLQDEACKLLAWRSRMAAARLVASDLTRGTQEAWQ
mgnify:CR=1 FL=1